MSGAVRLPSVPAMETRVVPEAFRRAETVRRLGLAMTRTLTVISGIVLAVLLVAVYVATGLAGGGVGRFLPDLVAAFALGGFVLAAPRVFARATRATTAGVTAERLVAVVAGYGVGWAALALVLGIG
jgi:hypothetical protein